MARWWEPAWRHAPAVWVRKNDGIIGLVGVQTLSMSQLLRLKWSSEKPTAIDTHNSAGGRPMHLALASLLRARRERPHSRAAEQGDDLASPHHSMTSSARASKIGGTSKPKALAVFRLTNLVPCCTGRSAGFAPLRILSTKLAERYHMSLML